MDEREPKMLRAFTSLEVNPAGQYDLSHIKSAPPAAPLLPGPRMHSACLKQEAMLQASAASLNKQHSSHDVRAQHADVWERWSKCRRSSEDACVEGW